MSASCIGEYVEILIGDPEAEYEQKTKIIRLQIRCVERMTLMGRNELCFCGSGKKYKLCHPEINERSLVAKLLTLYTKIDERNSHAIGSPCVKGCAHCCTDDFDVHFSEFLAILDYLEFGNEIKRYSKWKNLIANWNPKLTGSCFFLEQTDRTCNIYEVRPLICRNYGTTIQTSDPPCSLISDTCILLDETLYPKIDTIENRIIISGTNQRVRALKAMPLTLWLRNIDDDGELTIKKMLDLLKAATKSSVDDFIKIFLM